MSMKSLGEAIASSYPSGCSEKRASTPARGETGALHPPLTPLPHLIRFSAPLLSVSFASVKIFFVVAGGRAGGQGGGSPTRQGGLQERLEAARNLFGRRKMGKPWPTRGQARESLRARGRAPPEPKNRCRCISRAPAIQSDTRLTASQASGRQAKNRNRQELKTRLGVVQPPVAACCTQRSDMRAPGGCLALLAGLRQRQMRGTGDRARHRASAAIRRD